MRLRRHFDHDGDETGIDLAPMLDFVLNLLIFFIITAVFVKEFAITVSRPNNKAAESKEAKTILIHVSTEGEINVNGRIVDVRAVRANIERLHAIGPDDAVLVAADKDAANGILIQVLDQVREGGIPNPSITTGGK